MPLILLCAHLPACTEFRVAVPAVLLLFLLPMPSENSGNADANRAAFLKRKTAVIYTRVERLADSISRFAKFSFDESVLYVD